MRKLIIALSFLLAVLPMQAQVFPTAGEQPLKPRPDAFPSVQEFYGASKAVNMAATVEEMASWDRYPTYQTYLAMMQRWANEYPDLCSIDTIGLSLQGRLILAVHIEGIREADIYKPQFFYSSTIHGDEVTGYVMMLRLIDTLLASYGTSQRLTDLVNETAIYINPLANPDGTYHGGNTTVSNSVRENSAGIDLNRRYPDPFQSYNYAIPQENQAMIDYFSSHNFRLSANLHGGSEVMNYPWDCYTTLQNPHPQAAWWREVCTRFVDTSRIYSVNHFNDVTPSGVIAGGDWYVIHGGRQDYVNYYHNCLELTMEISRQKTLSSTRLPEYWNFLAPSFINYIAEIHSLPGSQGISDLRLSAADIRVYPNPVTNIVHVIGLPDGTPVELYDMQGRLRLKSFNSQFSVSDLTSGVYLLRAAGRLAKIIKK
ncbi:MAG: T9SS type A sorting domain-containing protein [Bacteroidales bacterium]|nr:T9SS type A sorting domain-containing protein [Bacteroidales bacterium]